MTSGRPVPDFAAMVAALPPRISHAALAWAERTPDAPALFDGAQEWSYRRLAQAVGSAAAQLKRLGVVGGDRVMIVCENSLAAVTLILGAGNFSLQFGAFKLDGIGTATFGSIILYALLGLGHRGTRAAR